MIGGVFGTFTGFGSTSGGDLGSEVSFESEGVLSGFSSDGWGVLSFLPELSSNRGKSVFFGTETGVVAVGRGVGVLL